jgi:putative flippase GtrA
MTDRGRTQTQFKRFVVVGLTNTVISYAAFRAMLVLLPQTDRRATIAQAVAYAAGVGWSFFWNRRWTFSAVPNGRFWRFLIVQLGCLISSSLAVGFLVDNVGLPATPVWIFVMAAITILNFLAVRFWAFATVGSADCVGPDGSR